MDLLITILIVLVVVLLFVVAFMLVRAALYGKPIQKVDPVEGIKVDPPVIAKHLAAAIRKPTISSLDPAQVDAQAFRDLHAALEAMYPRVHATLERRTVNDFGLVYTWKGRKPELEPVLFAAHQDVVPVEAAGLAEWTHPPFSGQIADGYVWGRGTLDIKNQLIALLEAVENLLKDGYRPQRTVILAFGHDEEVSGAKGAGSIVAQMAEEGLRLEAVLDEGGALTSGSLPGVKSSVAMVGTTEKGYLSLELTAQGEPGHSSMPPQHTAIGILGAALARLEASPLPAQLRTIAATLDEVGGLMPFSMQFLLANRWLFGRAILKRLMAKPMTNATVRTTQAITMISGGVKDNLLPREAKAVVNFRLMPGDTVANVCEHVRRALADERVTFQPLPGQTVREASPVSPVEAPAFQDLSRVIRQIFPDAAVAPYLVMGATDARYYTAICDNVYRFCPLRLTDAELGLMHGTNERISVEGLGRMVQFYGQLIRVWGERA
ncbi:MAG TPA: M20 family peptidase [Anaerolineaceae bacterium]